MDLRDTRLSSDYYRPAQLIALGRIAELSALLEVLLRNVLGQVMGIGEAAANALFLGDRAPTLVARITEVGKFRDAPEWFSEEAVDWAARVRKAIGKRDDLIHRAPVLLYRDEDDDERVIGWNRARRTHRPEPIDDDRLLDLIELLSGLQAEAMHKLFWGDWETPIGQATSPDA